MLRQHIHKMGKLEKEHVTKYFYKYSKNFYIKNFKNKLKTQFIKLAVDNKTDLTKILKTLNLIKKN